jgi:hypothetical protein
MRVDRHRNVRRMQGRREKAVSVGLSIATMLYWPVAAFLAIPWICPADSDGPTIRAFERASIACLVLAAASAFTLTLAIGAFGSSWLRMSGTIGIAMAIGTSANFLFAIPGTWPDSMQLAALAAAGIALVLAATYHRDATESH